MIEKLKPNTVDTLTVFVGVGGTGSSIVKRVAKMCRDGETENVSFVCLDTNVNDLCKIDEDLSVKIHTVQTSTTQTVGDYLNYDSDALRHWFPKNAVMYDKNVSVGAGQVRAISRLALNAAIKTGKITPLHDAIDELFRKDGRKLKSYIRVAMVSTASGGTGSGIVLPLSMYIRDYINSKYPQSAPWIRTMLLLPETLDSVIKSYAERESQRRNAYATVKEINAFMMKGSGFCNIQGPLDRYSKLHIDIPAPGTGAMKSLSLLPCDFCFLFDGQNSEDNTLINKAQYEEQAARALYEQNIGPMQLNSGSIEDNIIKEIADDREAPVAEEEFEKHPYMSRPATGNMGRSRFGGIGASMLRYPYKEIVEYVAYKWAMKQIGGDGQAAKWLKYDKEYEIKAAEARRKGLPKEDSPTIEQVYTMMLQDDKDVFSKDLRYEFIDGADSRLRRFLTALDTEILTNVKNNKAISEALNSTEHLAQDINYAADDDGTERNAITNLSLLRGFQANVEKEAARAAQSIADGIFRSSRSPQDEKDEYTIEALLKNRRGEFCHPNAARYFLYRVQMSLDAQIKTLSQLLDSSAQQLELYSPDANDLSFDYAKTKKIEERNLDAFCAAQSSVHKNDLAYYSALNTHFTGYHQAIVTKLETTAKLEAYKIGLEYVRELSKGYLKFFNTFGEKAASLTRRCDDIVENLRFRKGDSVRNVCTGESVFETRRMIEELVKSTEDQSEIGALLNSELNADIFLAIRENAAFEREVRDQSVVLEDKRKDVFEDTIIEYLKNSVRDTCKAIDMNIIEAIAMEYRLKTRLAARSTSGAPKSDEPEYDTVKSEDCEHYITEMIGTGMRLAAPGIQKMTSEEPRTIECCAYNKTLEDMRSFRVKDLINVAAASAVDTVSRYELRFFQAMYNITPDKLMKFAATMKSETGVRNAGLYHNAYESYGKRIGPDSTKNTAISTHIDKRWDSIAVMPELDFGFQANQMIRIHQAMVYALIHNAIRLRKVSASAAKKKVYRYENTDERFVELVVSNGTLCDEFYEILDALYINSAVVDNIEQLKAMRRKKNEVRNSDYEETEFYKDLEKFSIETEHDGKTSIFEIPLVYFNSLPNSMRFESEISAVVDAAIKTLEDEVYRWEKPDDARFIFCNELKKHYDLLIENYMKYPQLNYEIELKDNLVIDLVYRKIKKVYNCGAEPDDMDDILAEMKEKLTVSLAEGSQTQDS